MITTRHKGIIFSDFRAICIQILNSNILHTSALQVTARTADQLPPAVIRDRYTGQEIIFQYVLPPPIPTIGSGGPHMHSTSSVPPTCTGWLQKRGEIHIPNHDFESK